MSLAVGSRQLSDQQVAGSDNFAQALNLTAKIFGDYESFLCGMPGVDTRIMEQYSVTTIPATSMIMPPGHVSAAKAKGNGAYAAGVAMVVLKWYPAQYLQSAPQSPLRCL